MKNFNIAISLSATFVLLLIGAPVLAQDGRNIIFIDADKVNLQRSEQIEQTPSNIQPALGAETLTNTTPAQHRPAQTQPKPPYTEAQWNTCVQKSVIYQTIAATRDSGMSPQQSLSAAVQNRQNEEKLIKSGVSINWIRKAINQVYFDPRFTYARGSAFQQQMLDLCLYPNGHYKPLPLK